MKMQYNFKEEWPKIKKQLEEVSREAMVLAKKGEKEIFRLSKEGKKHLDETALNLKREHLYHLIGKEYASAKFPGTHTTKLQKLIDELEKIDRQKASLKRKPASKQVKKRTRRVTRSR